MYLNPAFSSNRAYSFSVLSLPVRAHIICISKSFEKDEVSGPGTTCSTINILPPVADDFWMFDRILTHSSSLQSCRIIFMIYASDRGTSLNISPARYLHRSVILIFSAHNSSLFLMADS